MNKTMNEGDKNTSDQNDESNVSDRNSQGNSEMFKTKATSNQRGVKANQAAKHNKYQRVKLTEKLASIEKVFKMIVPNEKKITKTKQLREFLAKRYNDVLAGKFAIAIQPYFDHFIQCDISDYCKYLEKMFNRDEAELKKFAFKIFDVNNDGRISESDLFELIRMCQGLKEGQVRPLEINIAAQDHTIYSLRERPQDFFIDIFADDYNKIIRAIEKKKELKGMLYSDFRSDSQFTSQITPKPGQIGFAKKKNQGSLKK